MNTYLLHQSVFCQSACLSIIQTFRGVLTLFSSVSAIFEIVSFIMYNLSDFLYLTTAQNLNVTLIPLPTQQLIAICNSKRFNTQRTKEYDMFRNTLIIQKAITCVRWIVLFYIFYHVYVSIFVIPRSCTSDTLASIGFGRV